MTGVRGHSLKPPFLDNVPRAMPVSTFTFQVELQNNYRSVARRKVVMGRAEYESDEHVLLKFLAWCLFYHPRLAVEKKMDGDFEPDLILQDYDMAVLRWIECGKVSINKLDKLTRRYPVARFYVLLAGRRDLEMIEKQIARKVERSSKIRLACFKESAFVPTLLPALAGMNEVWCNVSFPEGVEDAVENGLVEMEITLNGAWAHSALEVKGVG